MTERRRRLLAARLLPAALVLWAVAGWGAAVVERALRPPWDPPRAALWHRRPNGPRVGALRSFLAAVDAALPGPTRIAVAMPEKEGDPGEQMFRYLWVAYLLPRHDVVPPWRAGAAHPRYWASFRGAGVPPTGAVEIARWPEGALYRLGRPAHLERGAGAAAEKP